MMLTIECMQQCVMTVTPASMQKKAIAMLDHGMRYLRNCFIQDPTNFNNILGDVYVYQVGSLESEMAAWRRPEDVKVLPTLHRPCCAQCNVG
jgi:hypothetical protein